MASFAKSEGHTLFETLISKYIYLYMKCKNCQLRKKMCVCVCVCVRACVRVCVCVFSDFLFSSDILIS